MAIGSPFSRGFRLPRTLEKMKSLCFVLEERSFFYVFSVLALPPLDIEGICTLFSGLE